MCTPLLGTGRAVPATTTSCHNLCSLFRHRHCPSSGRRRTLTKQKSVKCYLQTAAMLMRYARRATSPATQTLNSFRLPLSDQLQKMSTLMPKQLIEEQQLPKYSSRHYFPVRVGSILDDRYRIITKFGFGAYSTVWLAKDQRTDIYVSVKVCTQEDSDSTAIGNELNILRHLASSPKEHPGSKYARLADDFFRLKGATGSHECIASRPQGPSLWMLQRMFPDGKVPKEVVAHVVQRLLGCVNWLFCDCDIIHTEITAQNVLLEMSDTEHFRAIEEEEAVEPSLPVDDGSYPIYLSRGNPVSMLQLTLDPVLTDFGSSRSALEVNKDWWMPDTHRAPEILLGVPWDAQVDVWSIGIMALELLEGRNLFHPIDKAHKRYVLPLAVSQYISYMGLPPLWMIHQSNNPVIKTFFDAEGNWIAEPPIPEASLDDFVTSIEGCKEKALFLDFINRILQWDPAKRGQSAHLFCHEWLAGPEPDSMNKQ